MPIGAGSTYALAATGGSATTTLVTANLPAHNHPATSTVTDPGHTHSISPSGFLAIDNGNGGSSYLGGGSKLASGLSINTATTSITVSTTTSNTGSGTAATTISPYLGIYYIIKT